MKKFFCLLLTVVAISAMLLTGCGSDNGTDKNNSPKNNPPAAEKVSLNVAAAASLTDVMKELATKYQQENPNVELVFNFGSSGALQQAIENGGNTDLFFSAGQKQMDALEKAGLLANNTRKNLLINDIVLIVPADGGLPLTSFQDLTRKDVRKVAIGGNGVPVGQYTQELFKNLNLADTVEYKEVLATDSRQVLNWVALCEADCGVVYYTDAVSCPDVKIACSAPSDSYSEIIYPVAVMKDSKNLEAAKDFLAFASSEKAKAIYKMNGFKIKN